MRRKSIFILQYIYQLHKQEAEAKKNKEQKTDNTYTGTCGADKTSGRSEEKEQVYYIFF